RRREAELERAGRRSTDVIRARTAAQGHRTHRGRGRRARLDDDVIHVPAFVRADLLAEAPEGRIVLVGREAEAHPGFTGVAGEIGGDVSPALRRSREDVLTAEGRGGVELDDRAVAAVHGERDPLAAVHRELDPAAVHRLRAAIGLRVDPGVECELAPGRKLERGRDEGRVLQGRVAQVYGRAGRVRGTDLRAPAAALRTLVRRVPLVARAA